MNTAEIIYQKTKSFPEPVAKEALEFINYLEYKYQMTAQDKPKKKLKSKLTKLKSHNSIVGDPEELVSLKVGEWSETDNL